MRIHAGCTRTAIYWLLLVAFSCVSVFQETAYAHSAGVQNTVLLPPGTLLSGSPRYSLPLLRAIAVDEKDPFKINFIVDSADQETAFPADHAQVELLTQYFLSFLTLPENELWVNLSPYEQTRVVARNVAQTPVGRDLLIQDYLLKHLAASMTYPGTAMGKEFWKKMIARYKSRYGTSDVPVSNFNKVWVVPDSAVVYEKGGSAFVSESRLNVLLEQDYLSLYKNGKTASGKAQEGSNITRELILPALQREVNEGKYFAPLRQMYNALILAIWFKKRFKSHLLGRVYTDRGKTAGLSINDPNMTEKVYANYLRAVKKGVYNFIRDDFDPVLNREVPRKYFSGGFSFEDAAKRTDIRPLSMPMDVAMRSLLPRTGRLSEAAVNLDPVGVKKLSLLKAIVLAGGVAVGALAAMPQQAAAAPQAPSAPVVAPTAAANVSSAILRAGAWIPPSDRVYLSLLKSAVSLDDVLSLDGKKIGWQTLRVDKKYFERNWDKNLFNSTNNNWAVQTVVLAFQDKQGLSADGILGPETRLKLQEVGNGASTAPAGGPPSRPLTIEEKQSFRPQAEQGIWDSVAGGLAAQLPWPQSMPSNLLPRAHIQPALLRGEGTAAHALPAPVPVRVDVVPAPAKALPYTMQAHVKFIPVHAQMISPRGGVLKLLDPGKREFRQGQAVLTITSPQLEASIAAFTERIRTAREAVARLERMMQQGTAVITEMENARREVASLEQKLAQAQQARAAGVVTAPTDLTMDDVLLSDNTEVQAGQPLFGYFDTHRFRANLQLPATVVNFNHMTMSINGQPVQGSISTVSWGLAPSRKNAIVSLEFRTPELMPAEADVQIAITPPENLYPQLDVISDKGYTLAPVAALEQVQLRAPANGAGGFLVTEGAHVTRGEPIAVMDGGPLLEEYKKRLASLESVARELQASSSQYMLRERRDALESQYGEHLKALRALKDIIERMTVTAAQDGRVSWIAVDAPGVYQEGSPLAVIDTGYATIGTIKDDAPGRILLPASWDVKRGDAIVVETPQGNRLPAEVTAVNRSPFSKNADIQGHHSSQIRVLDRQGILIKGMPVKVIPLHSPADREAVAAILKSARAAAQAAPVAAAPGPPPPPKVIVPLANPRPAGISVPRIRSTGTSAGNPNWYTEIDEQVRKNNLTAAGEQQSLLIQQQTAALAAQYGGNGITFKPGFMIFGPTWQSDLSHMLNGGSIPTMEGSAWWGFKPMVSGFDQALSLRAQAYRVKASQLAEVNRAVKIAIEIQATNALIEHAQATLGSLRQAAGVAASRTANGSEHSWDNGDALTSAIMGVSLDINAWRSQLDSLKQNYLLVTGQAFSQATALPWNDDFFGTITAQGEAALRAQILSHSSRNPAIQGAISEAWRAVLKIREANARQTGSATLSDFSPFQNISPDGVVDTSHLKPLPQGGDALKGALTLGDFNLPLQLQQARAIMEAASKETTTKLSVAVGDIRSLHARISGALQRQKAEGDAMNQRAGSGISLASDMRGEIQRNYAAGQEVIRLKGQYLEKIAGIYELGGTHVPTVRVADSVPGTGFSVAIPRAPAMPTPAPQRIELEAPPAMPVVTHKYAFPMAQPRGTTVLRAGQVTFPSELTPAQAWPLMRTAAMPAGQAALTHIKDLLIGDTNALVRADALTHFTAEYAGKKGFTEAARDIVVRSPYRDVSDQIVKFLLERPDHTPQVFVDLIFEADSRHNASAVGIGYDALADLFTMDPLIVSDLSRSAFASPEYADKVMLTILAREGDDSIARARLLQSPYWTAQSLAAHYAQTMAAVEAGALSAADHLRATQLASLLYDEMLRRQAYTYAEEIFRLGMFNHVASHFGLGDVRVEIKLRSLLEETRRFLLTSSDWRNMKRHLYPSLYAAAQRTTDKLVGQYTGTSVRTIPFDSRAAAEVFTPRLAYFDGLSLERKLEYIADSKNIVELAALLVKPLNDELRNAICMRLMSSRQGRILVLRAYVHEPEHSELSESIESLDWQSTIKFDATHTANEAETRILRDALEKFAQTGERWPIDLYGYTFRIPEIHAAKLFLGPQALRAHTQVMATGLVQQVLSEAAETRTVFWAGFPVREAEEMSVLRDVGAMVKNARDPQEVGDLLNALESRGHRDVQRVASLIKRQRDIMAADLEANDQHFPPVPSILWFVAAGLMSMVLFPLVWFKGRKLLDSRKPLKQLYEEWDARNPWGEDKTYSSDRAMLSSSKEAASAGILSSWRNILEHWVEEDMASRPQPEMIRDMDLILLHAGELLNLLPYADDLDTGTGNYAGKYRAAYFRATKLALRTAFLLQEYLRAQVSDGADRGNLDLRLKLLTRHAGNFSRFQRLLEDRINLDTMLGYKFKDGHPVEWFIYPAARFVLLINFVLNRSASRINREREILLRESNALIPGLYSNVEALQSRSRTNLKNTITNAVTWSDNLNTYRWRKFRSRTLMLVPMTVFLISAIPAYFFVGGMTVALGAISTLIFTSIGVFNHAWTHMVALHKATGSDREDILNKLEADVFGPAPEGPRLPGVLSEQDIVNLGKQEGREAIARELDTTHAPLFDVVIIVAEKESAVSGLRQYARQRRGRLLRNDIPVEVMYSEWRGSGNGFLDVLERVKEKFADGSYRGYYSHLKPWADSRILIVFHGKDAHNDPRLLDLAIANGYRTGESMAETLGVSANSVPEPEIAVVYTRDAYFGPIRHSGDGQGITLMSSHVSLKDLPNLGLVATEFPINGNPAVVELREKVSVGMEETMEKVSGKRSSIMQYLRARFNLENHTVKQFPAFSGILTMRRDAVSVFSRLVDQEAEPMEYAHMMADLLIPLSLTHNQLDNPFLPLDATSTHETTRLHQYRIARAAWPDMKNMDSSKLDHFYRAIRLAANRVVRFSAFVPPPGLEALIHVRGDDGVNSPSWQKFDELYSATGDILSGGEVVPFPGGRGEIGSSAGSPPNLAQSLAAAPSHQRSSGGKPDSAQTSRGPGGVDLTRTADRVSIADRAREVEESNSRVPVPDVSAFRGFDFQIIQLRPLANPADFFLSRQTTHQNQS